MPITLIKNKGGVTDHHAPGKRKNSCYFLQNPSYFLSSGNSCPRQINWLDRHKNSVFSSLFLRMCLPAQGEKHFCSKTKHLSLQHPCFSLRGFAVSGSVDTWQKHPWHHLPKGNRDKLVSVLSIWGEHSPHSYSVFHLTLPYILDA